MLSLTDGEFKNFLLGVKKMDEIDFLKLISKEEGFFGTAMTSRFKRKLLSMTPSDLSYRIHELDKTLRSLDSLEFINATDINEQSNDEFKVGDQLDGLEKMYTVQQKLDRYLPILNKTTEELLDIRDKEIVNQVMNTNETNRSILNNMNGFWNTAIDRDWEKFR